MTEKPDLSALLGSRICHDLISPIGAIGNGIELLAMSGQGESPEVRLIADSVASANARIRLFRIAFGAAPADARIGRPEITAILADAGRGARVTVDWLVAGDQPRREVRLAVLLAMCLESAMPWGGRIAVDRDEGRWRLTARARRFKLDAALWDGLTQRAPATELSAATVHFGLARMDLVELRRSLAMSVTETEIVLGF